MYKSFLTHRYLNQSKLFEATLGDWDGMVAVTMAVLSTREWGTGEEG